MTRNSVAANLLMAFLIIGGLLMAFSVKQEVFPEFELDIVNISVIYPGASPEEVEQGIILPIEESIRGLQGIKKVTSRAYEGNAAITVELITGTETIKIMNDIKNAVDRIRTFPAEIERPLINLVTNRNQVISMIIYGEDLKVLRKLAEKARNELLKKPNITQVALSGVRNYEISVEIPLRNLRANNLSLGQVAAEIRRNSIDVPGGGIKTDSGELLLRTTERKELAEQFAEMEILSNRGGSNLRLKDIALIKDTFEEGFESASYNGVPAVRVNIERVGKQTPIDIADTVKEYISELNQSLPDGFAAVPWADRSEMYNDRINLLLNNAYIGLILVLLCLGLFLEIRLAFWVTMGIPISFLGSIFLMPAFDVSINMISLFAFIVTLGIVVDDAIVVGENIFRLRKEGKGLFESAIEGAKEVAVPVTFSILTTVAAFTPLLFVPGVSGKFFRVIPLIVIFVLLVSLIESIFILPAHLAHVSKEPKSKFMKWINSHQVKVSLRLEYLISTYYKPFISWALSRRYLMTAIGFSMLIASFGVVAGKHILFTFLPKIESDRITATAVLPYGVAIGETKEMEKKLINSLKDLIAEYEEKNGAKIDRGIFSKVGSRIGGMGPRKRSGAGASNITSVQVLLVQSGQRNFSAREFTNRWRKSVGDIPGLESLNFKSEIGAGGGKPANVQLSHESIEILEAAASELADNLRGYKGVYDIENGFSGGKRQFDFSLTESARSLGLNAANLGRQLRDAFYGAEALRFQRERNEVKVMVRLPEDEKSSKLDMENFLVRTPGGGEIPLMEAANFETGRSYTSIKRTDGQRTINVEADVNTKIANTELVISSLKKEILPSLTRKYPGLSYSFEGENRRRSDSLNSLKIGYPMALLAIFALLAIPFKSYIQPIIVMSAIPFGFIGALAGHVIMDFTLSFVSIMGIVALSGIVVNDSLVLVDAANRFRREGQGAFDAIINAAARRFRPILLTSLTTFFGLAPMILETSVQARFLIPMAISLGFGVMFATLVILILVPCFYLMVEDFLGLIAAEDKEIKKDQSDVEAQDRLADQE